MRNIKINQQFKKERISQGGRPLQTRCVSQPSWDFSIWEDFMYTQIPHEVIDRHMSDLSGKEFKVLIYIINTLYWGDSFDEMAIEPMSKMTGLSKEKIKETVNSLLRRNFLKIRIVKDLGEYKFAYYLKKKE